MCAEQISLEAQLCRFCGARFNVSMRGYCTTCHQIMDADENNACTRCGSNLVDLQVESDISQNKLHQQYQPYQAQPPFYPISLLFTR
jgi:uncharacterized paraquat-inducible protein A